MRSGISIVSDSIEAGCWSGIVGKPGQKAVRIRFVRANMYFVVEAPN